MTYSDWLSLSLYLQSTTTTFCSWSSISFAWMVKRIKRGWLLQHAQILRACRCCKNWGSKDLWIAFKWKPSVIYKWRKYLNKTKLRCKTKSKNRLKVILNIRRKNSKKITRNSPKNKKEDTQSAMFLIC